MRIQDIKDSFNVDLEVKKGKPNWQKFTKDFSKKINETKDINNIYTVFEHNKHILNKLKEHDLNEWQVLSSLVMKKSFGSYAVISETILPRNDSDVRYILNFLKEGILVEAAADKLQDVLRNDDLQNHINSQKQYMPGSNFADTLANFIVNLEPKNARIKKMQDAIIHDPDLAAMVISPIDIKEGAADEMLDSASKKLHTDLENLKNMSKLDSEESKKKLYLRANQIQVHPDDLKNHYIKNHRSKSICWHAPMAEAALSYIDKVYNNDRLNENKKSQLLLKYAHNHNVDSDKLEEKVRELLSKKPPLIVKKEKQPVKEKANKVKLDRLYAAGKTMIKAEEARTFGRKVDHKEGNCFNCDGTGTIAGKWNSKCPSCSGTAHVKESVNWKPDESWLQEATKQLIERSNNGQDWFNIVKESAHQFSTRSNHNKDAYSWAESNLTYRAYQNNLIESNTLNHLGWFVHSYNELKNNRHKIDNLCEQYASLQDDYNKGFDFAWRLLNKICEDVIPFTGNPKAAVKHASKGAILPFQTKKPGEEKFKSSGGEMWIDEPEINQQLATRLNKKAVEYKNYIDRKISLGHVKTWKDASALLLEIRKDMIDTFGDDEQIRDHIWYAFLENTGEGIYGYIENKAKESGNFQDLGDEDEAVHEDVINFTQSKQALEADTLAKHLKKLIDQTDIRYDDDVDAVISVMEKELDKIGIKFENFSELFKKKTGKSFTSYLYDKQKDGLRNAGFGLDEDVVDFPNRTELTMNRLAEWADNLIHNSFIPSKEDSDKVKQAIINKVKAAGIDLKEFDRHFKDSFDVSIINALTLKRLEDSNSEADMHRFESSINEAISDLTANKCRTGLWRFLRKFVDSSNISMMSNFESFEGKDKIVLKMAVYESNPKKLNKILDKVKERLKKEGWVHGAGEDKFIKGDEKDGVMISFKPIAKMFRSGAYKNREVPTLPIEIIGSKRKKLDSKPEEVPALPQ